MKKADYFHCFYGSQILLHIWELGIIKNNKFLGFPGGAVVKNLPASAGDTGSSPGPGGCHMLRSN